MMGLDNFILECEKENEEQRKNIAYYKRQNERLKLQNNRLLELCMYALIRDTKIYNHELDNTNILKFTSIIENNLNDDTYTLRKKIIDEWGE